MTYRTLTVHLDTSHRVSARLSLALTLARAYGAHLNGVFSAFEPQPREFHVMAGTAGYYDEHRKRRAEQRGAIERLFHAELARAQVEGVWIGGDADPIAVLTQHSRTADLTILGQTDLNDPGAYVADHFAETVILGAGGPVLVMPHTGNYEAIGKHVLIAWNGSREAARAAHDALPFITRAARVTIAAASATVTSDPTRASCADLATLFARHGATMADIAHFPRHTLETTGDALLSYAAEGGYDLLVMGAYGHSRQQEMVLGGATRTVLATMTLPVLMSH